MNSKGKSLSAMFHDEKSQSQYPDTGSVMDKENIQQKARMAKLDALRKDSPYPFTTRGRKNSDNSHDRPPAPRGLQEINNSSNAGPRRRIQSSTDAGSTNQTFAKSRFTIFGEAESSNSEIQTTGKLINAKPKRDNFSRPLAPLDNGRDNLRRRRQSGEGNKSTSSRASHQQSSSRQSTSRQSTSVQKSSPTDLPVISKPILKIKEAHRRASLVKRKQRQVYDVLSLELAYNIDYMSEYVRFQMEMNDKNQLSPNFLSGGLSADQRRLVIKYLIGSTTYYKYPSFILYQAVKIFDCYIDTDDVKLQELQILALASLWIALKKDLITDDIPEAINKASTIINLAAPVFNGNKQPLIEYEKKILMALNFEISFSDPFSILSLYTVMIKEIRNLESSKVEDFYYYGSYLIDLSVLLEDLCHVSAVHLAAISAEIALVLVTSSDENLKNPQWSHWRKEVLAIDPVFEQYRLPDSQMNELKNKLLQKVIISSDSNTDFYIVYKKYCSKRYGSVSKLMMLKVSTLYLQKITNPQYDFRPIVF